ncbi:hypothetical protein WI981_001280 [Klebsiella pneumoniae]
MTSKLTIEQAKRLRNDFECWQQDYDPKDDKEQYDMFGRGMVAMDMLIAGMYQEPVAYTDERNLGYIDRGRETAYLWGKQNSEASDVALYRHAQPAPVAQCPYPCGWDTLNKLAIQDAAFVALALVAGEPATESIRSAVISNNDRLLKVISFCRDMMPQAGNSPVIPDGSQAMLRRWLAFGRGMQNAGSQLPHNLIAETEAMLADAPQPQNAPQNIPEIIPGWIPVSERIPDCWCRTCRPVAINDMRFVVCPDCGNKICPRANDHRNACTGSNEPGQEGSAYPDTPQEVKP